jgi:hypothetical protein
MHKGMRKHIHAVRLELRNLPRTRVAASGEDWVGPCGRGAEGGVAKGGTFACIAFHYKAKWQLTQFYCQERKRCLQVTQTYRLAKHLPLYCA